MHSTEQCLRSDRNRQLIHHLFTQYLQHNTHNTPIRRFISLAVAAAAAQSVTDPAKFSKIDETILIVIILTQCLLSDRMQCGVIEIGTTQHL